MNKILEYLDQKYRPLSVIVYGSYADGSNNQNSDFDAVIITRNSEVFHDTSIVDDVRLDVFVYPLPYIENGFDCDEFIQIFDGIIVSDTDDTGKKLKEKVLEYIDTVPLKSDEEIFSEIEWCKKMFERTLRKDAEGMFRKHWLLTDSLEIFCDAKHLRYLGPKKTLKRMEKDFPQEYMIYEKALFNADTESIEKWTSCLSSLLKTQ